VAKGSETSDEAEESNASGCSKPANMAKRRLRSSIRRIADKTVIDRNILVEMGFGLKVVYCGV
jgi:hypothetical protein